MNLASRRLILASQSPRRKQLLQSVGLEFDVQPANLDEDAEQADSPLELVEKLAQSKANVLATQHPEAVVLAADTIVVISDSDPKLKGEVINKPTNAQHAREMLTYITGRKHFVLTAFCLKCEAQDYVYSQVVQSAVELNKLTANEIESYVASGEPLDKAGSYAVQGKGAYFVKSIEGSYTNVVGLPLAEVVAELRNIGLWQPEYLLKVLDN